MFEDTDDQLDYKRVLKLVDQLIGEDLDVEMEIRQIGVRSEVE